MVTGPAHSAAARAKLTLFFLEGRGRVRGSIRALTWVFLGECVGRKRV